MCSIFGAFGQPDHAILARLATNAGDRGRDGGRWEVYDAPDGRRAVLGNWRAAPTPERHDGPLQPYDGVVHNGTIANDRELGARPGEIDSMVLPRVLDRSSVGALAASLRRIRGSYALGIWTGSAVLLAANYKPIHYWSPDGVTIYFSSMARHFDGVVPFGQAPVALSPYSALDLATGEAVDLPRAHPNRALVIASAGLDSTTVAAVLASRGYDEVRLLHFRYGCAAESRESAAIPAIAARLGCSYVFLPLDYSACAGNSPLLATGATISAPVAGAELAHEWVPARNLVMLALATAYAEANGFGTIALGNNLEEAGAYPDNEEAFTERFAAVLPYAVGAGRRVDVVCPVANLMKPEVVALGIEHGAPYDLTWSCYRAGERHCGDCGPCFMRRVAFERNGLIDPVFEAAA